MIHLCSIARFTLLITCPWIAAIAAEPSSEEPSSPDPSENKVSPESETPAQPAQPLIKKISDDTYQVGKITFNKKTREISLPTQTNIIDTGILIEFILCHSNGEKVHESLLVTEADPTNLNIALKLLNYKESQELFRPINADGRRAKKLPVVADDIRKAARFTIHLSWKEGDTKKTAPVNQWLQHHITTKSMPVTPWIYNGSYIHRNQFKAKVNGNILAIFSNESALANYSGIDREDDTIWAPAEKLPREGSQVTVTLKPWTGKL